MVKNKLDKGTIVIYKTSRGPRLDIKLDKQTIWITQKQMAELFNKDRSVITKHISNIFREDELVEKSNVQKMHIANSDKPVNFYNLDVIISVGYRVNSKRATQFRIWATKVLKDYLVEGYVINKKRLLETDIKLSDLQKTIQFLNKKSKKKLLKGQEAEILDLISDYSKTLNLLEQYDKDEVQPVKGRKGRYLLKYDKALNIVEKIKESQKSELFGREYIGKFEGVINGLYLTFDKKELYKTIEDKAAHLLYLTIKDHPFTDGNKRIASFLFVYFLDKNNYLYKKDGERKINDNALVALALLIAESKPREKEIIVNIITNLITN